MITRKLRPFVRLTAVAWLAAFALSNHAGAANWPQWRGPDGQGHADSRLPLSWTEADAKWKTPIPGRGWSSPVIWGNQIWFTTAHETPAKPEDVERRLKAKTTLDIVTVVESVRLHAICVDRRDGRILHDIALFEEKEPQWVHERNSYASPTPVIEEGRVYCHFGAFGTACIDTASGKVLWRNTELVIRHENGPGSTPVLWRDLLIVHCDGSDQQYIVALDKRTGKIAWKTDRTGKLRDSPQMKKAYATPLVVDVRGKPQLLSPAADWLYAYDPATGAEIWKLSYGVLGFSNAPRPVIGHGLAYICTCFTRPELIAVRYSEFDGANPPPIVWRYTRGVPQVPSPLLVGNELFFVNDSGGLVTCLDARTGEEVWKERIGGSHSVAPLFGDGRIYLFSSEGMTTVLAPGREFKKLAESKLPGRIMASPAAVDDSLYIRTDQALYRFDAPK